MPVEIIRARTILRRQKRIESWFVSRYGMNLHRGCAHDCVYCDGRTEKYRVEGSFGHDIGVKINALQVLDRELDPARRRKPLRMPQRLWDDLVDENDRVTLLLDHIDFLCKLLGRRSPYGRAAYTVAMLDRSIREMRDEVRSLRGVGEVTERLIDEILNTGSCRYYEALLGECGAT